MDLPENDTMTWMFEYKDGLWLDMEPCFAAELSSAKAQGHDTVEMTSPLVINGDVVYCRYTFDLTGYIQTNHHTKTQRRIRCIVIVT